MKLRNIFNVRSQRICLQASIGIGIASSIAGVFMAAAMVPMAVPALIAGASSILFATKNLRKLKEINPATR